MGAPGDLPPPGFRIVPPAAGILPATEEKLKGKIMDVVEKGYLLNDKVIRFAKVVTGS